MNITKHNCESFFLDYYEKRLSPVEVAELLFFLEEHPDLKEVFESYEEVHLEHDKVNFPDKELLKKKYSKEELDVILSSEITRINCEQFFVARAEEILNDDQTRRLYAFLAAHPELKKEFDLIQECKLVPEKIVFEHKDLLKKEPINAENREEYFIRAIENDLSALEQKQLAAFLQKNPGYKEELEVFRKTILVPEKIVFADKASLKRKERKPVIIALWSQQRTYYAAAAAILLLVGLFFFLRNNGEGKQEFAQNGSKNNNVQSAKENSAVIRKEQAPAQANQKEEINNSASVNKQQQANSLQPGNASNSVAIKKPETPKQDVKENSSPAPAPILINEEEKPLAQKADDKKKTNEAPVQEEQVIAKTEDNKKDSAAVKPEVQPGDAVASVVKSKAGADDYQTVAQAATKKLRSVLGIKKAECETSDKLDLWDVALAAKGGVKRLLKAKELEVEKKCDGNGTKVDYVFAAGNFEISKGTRQKQ